MQIPELPPFRLRVCPRLLRFKQPAGTSRGVYTERRVWYIVATSADPHLRFTGLGECAPLHDLSCDYSNDYEEVLRRVCRDVERSQRLDIEALRDLPSVRFGLEVALISAAAALSGEGLKLFDTPLAQGEEGLAINGLVWMGNFEQMSQRMEEKLAQGFHCVKLKIGAIDFDSELELIRRLRSRYSADAVELRVDANGAFSPADALRKIEALARYDLHSIEQPLRQGQWEAMAQLCRRTPLPVALDEELIGVNRPEAKRELLRTIRPQYLVIKPSLHGGLGGSEEWVKLADENGIGYWVTSALESNVGLNAIAQWVSSLTSRPRLPQGLGTGQLFVENYERTPMRLEGETLWCGTPRQRAFEQEVRAFDRAWNDPSPTLEVMTSGSTGKPQRITVKKAQMEASAQATLQALGIQPGDTAMLCLPLNHIAGQMMCVRSLIAPLRRIIVAPTSHPYAGRHEAPAFAALTPMQVYESLRVPHERSLMRRTRCLIIGGGAVSPEVEERLRKFPNAVWATYGMTETLSHIALRRISGPAASTHYHPLPGVRLGLSPQGTLTIDAPHVCDTPLVTRDLATLFDDGSFILRGRLDNVVCSGGLKLQMERIEEKLGSLPLAVQITAVADERLGEAVTLLYADSTYSPATLERLCRDRLSRYEVPRHYICVPRLPLTETDKPARAQARRMAAAALHTDTSASPADTKA